MRPEAMPTIAALLGLSETWLTWLFGAAMVAQRLRMQGCAVAGMLAVFMCLSRQRVVEAELHGTRQLGRRVGKAQSECQHWHHQKRQSPCKGFREGCAPGCVASCVFCKNVY